VDIGWSNVALGRHDGGVNVGIRDARVDDVDELGDVHVRAWQAAYRGVMPDEYLDGLEPSERAAFWTRFFDTPRPDRRLNVVTVNDRVIGFACFGTCPESEDAPLGELYAINLDPDYWGRGLGRALLSEVTLELGAFGDSAVLWVVPQNVRARGLYEAAGWMDDGGRRRDEVLGARVDEMRYRIMLRP
jgi:ribosomal protein S18 acetylase RimI-like enzyme